MRYVVVGFFCFEFIRANRFTLGSAREIGKKVEIFGLPKTSEWYTITLRTEKRTDVPYYNKKEPPQ